MTPTDREVCDAVGHRCGVSLCGCTGAFLISHHWDRPHMSKFLTTCNSVEYSKTRENPTIATLAVLWWHVRLTWVQAHPQKGQRQSEAPLVWLYSFRASVRYRSFKQETVRCRIHPALVNGYLPFAHFFLPPQFAPTRYFGQYISTCLSTLVFSYTKIIKAVRTDKDCRASK